jgi:hypothetical protein
VDARVAFDVTYDAVGASPTEAVAAADILGCGVGHSGPWLALHRVVDRVAENHAPRELPRQAAQQDPETVLIEEAPVTLCPEDRDIDSRRHSR